VRRLCGRCERLLRRPGSAEPTCDGAAFFKAASTPATDPFVTAVGGTRLFANGLTGADQSETVWNEPDFSAARGGGFSVVYRTPICQRLVHLPSRHTRDDLGLRPVDRRPKSEIIGVGEPGGQALAGGQLEGDLERGRAPFLGADLRRESHRREPADLYGEQRQERLEPPSERSGVPGRG